MEMGIIKTRKGQIHKIARKDETGRWKAVCKMVKVNSPPYGHDIQVEVEKLCSRCFGKDIRSGQWSDTVRINHRTGDLRADKTIPIEGRKRKNVAIQVRVGDRVMVMNDGISDCLIPGQIYTVTKVARSSMGGMRLDRCSDQECEGDCWWTMCDDFEFAVDMPEDFKKAVPLPSVEETAAFMGVQLVS